MPGSPRFDPVWTASPLSGAAFSSAVPTPAELGAEWIELGQAWRPAPEPGFNRGWARIRWDQAGLLFEAVFLQRAPANRARRLNERTWEMGDIAEFFLQETATGRYLELHVTPENHRLQLLWPLGGLDRFRSGSARLEDFQVPDPQWAGSMARVSAGYWTATAYLPFACLGLAGADKLPGLRTAVCRYDRSLGPELLSSTARLAEPNFHRHAEWAELRLAH